MIITAAALLFTTSCSSNFSWIAVEKGRSDALADLRAGKLVTETAGLPMPSEDIYQQLLLQRYGVEQRRVADCIVDRRILSHARGYNEIMMAEIKKRFGPDVFDRTLTKAAGVSRQESR